MKLVKVLIVSAIFGYTLAYSQLYMFHILGLIWSGVTVYKFYTSKKLRLDLIGPILIPWYLFFAYALLTFLWVPDSYVWLRYMFYLSCGSLVILAIFLEADSTSSLKGIFNWAMAALVLNFSIGLIETLTSFRLPMSPYSDYVTMFGHNAVELSSHSLSQATGFNWNPNSFTFVLLLGLPFALLSKKKLIITMGLVLSSWFIVNLGSRAHFLAFIATLALLFFYKKLDRRYFLALAVAAVCIGGALLAFDMRGTHRILDISEDIQKGLTMLKTGEFTKENSLSQRAVMYRFGLSEFVKTYGFGLGLGGIESRLIQEGFPKTTFHFFFLQLLIDVGVMAFSLIMAAYVYLAVLLRRIYWNSKDACLAYMAGGCSLSLLVAIPASLAPSSIHYNLTYYVLIGLSLSVLKLHSDQAKHENSATVRS